jgi:hypothetical protein
MSAPTRVCKWCDKIFEIDMELALKVNDFNAQKFCTDTCAFAFFEKQDAERDAAYEKWKADQRQAYIDAGESVPEDYKP